MGGWRGQQRRGRVGVSRAPRQTFSVRRLRSGSRTVCDVFRDKCFMAASFMAVRKSVLPDFSTSSCGGRGDVTRLGGEGGGGSLEALVHRGSP